MCGLCSLVRRSQRLKKSDLSVFNTRHLSDQITQQQSTSSAFKLPSSNRDAISEGASMGNG